VSPPSTAQPATTCCGPKSSCGTRSRLSRRSAGRCPRAAASHDYVFEAGSPTDDRADSVRLSELFENNNGTLILYSFMYGPRDGGGVSVLYVDRRRARRPGPARHAALNFAVVAKSPLERFREHARSRGWGYVRLLSSAGNTFNADYHAEASDGKAQYPLAHVFVRRDGEIRHAYTTELLWAPPDPGGHPRHVDSISGRSGTCSTSPPTGEGRTGIRGSSTTAGPRSLRARAAA
jgi:predicted dithiol-disulfide oxidoreductase (DUF899 family)